MSSNLGNIRREPRNPKNCVSVNHLVVRGNTTLAYYLSMFVFLGANPSTMFPVLDNTSLRYLKMRSDWYSG